MAFDWYIPKVNENFSREQSKKFISGFTEEIKKHAELLFKLNYSKKAVSKQIKMDIAWEFGDKKPSFSKKVDGIIKEIFDNKRV